MTAYILAIDQGTTGTTALLVGHDLRIHGRQTVDFPQHFPRPGWVEHDPEEIWVSTRKAVLDLLESTATSTGQIQAIGITNQRETTLLWERKNSRPVGNAIVWQCRRTAEICQNLKKQGMEETYRQGLAPPYSNMRSSKQYCRGKRLDPSAKSVMDEEDKWVTRGYPKSYAMRGSYCH